MVSAIHFRRRWIVANGSLLTALCCAALLYRFPPASYHFYPLCPIQEYLGALCPGCGATRAMSALLHGQFVQAIRLNALAVLLLPFALVFGVQSYTRALGTREYHWPRVPTAAVYSCVMLAAVFTVVRNLVH